MLRTGGAGDSAPSESGLEGAAGCRTSIPKLSRFCQKVQSVKYGSGTERTGFEVRQAAALYP